MYVRKKLNPSGVVSVQVIDKSRGQYKVLRTVGSSSDASEIERLYDQGKKWIASWRGDQDMFAATDKQREEKQLTDYFLNNIENILLNGTQSILNQVFKLTGFDSIDDEILKHLVIARLCQPASKAGTVDYLRSYFDEDVTNTELPAKEVYDQYCGLWVIEKAYRVTKGTLEMRPMFHFTPKRIEAHVCICFVVYKVYKELERILKLSDINLSVDKVLNIAKTITTLKIKLPACGEVLTKTMLITQKHNSIEKLFNKNFWENVASEPNMRF
jgi:transposase